MRLPKKSGIGLIDDVTRLLKAIKNSVNGKEQDKLPEVIKNVKKWLCQSNGNEACSIIDCIEANPPKEVLIKRVLSREGNQKLVFEGIWKPMSSPIAIKKFRKSPKDIKKRLQSELIAHGLSIDHPNILRTHLLQNERKEYFLVERKIKVLNDNKKCDLIFEGANLLNDLAHALAKLAVEDLVHGDIKPNNIGFYQGRFVLLDFGICRKASDFKIEEPTGSYRTRAPEVLSQKAPQSHKSDIWALGATVFNLFVGRFPFYKQDESYPRSSQDKDGTKRKDFLKELKNRAEKSWKQFVDSSLREISEPINEILKICLEKDPRLRVDASKLLLEINKKLASFLRISKFKEGTSWFKPKEEAEQLVKYVKMDGDLNIIPKARQYALLDRLEELTSYLNDDLDADLLDQIKALKGKLNRYN